MSYYRHVPNKIKKTFCGKLESFGHSLLFWDICRSSRNQFPRLRRFRFHFRNKVDKGISRASRFYNYVYSNTLLYILQLTFFFIRLEDRTVMWFFTITRRHRWIPYPRIAGDSHILFQPITAISSLLDLIGPLPQGRRLFGPTVLESRQPSRNLPIFSPVGIVQSDGKKSANELSSWKFSISNFGNSSKRLEGGRISKNRV